MEATQLSAATEDKTQLSKGNFFVFHFLFVYVCVYYLFVVVCCHLDVGGGDGGWAGVGVIIVAAADSIVMRCSLVGSFSFNYSHGALCCWLVLLITSADNSTLFMVGTEVLAKSPGQPLGTASKATLVAVHGQKMSCFPFSFFLLMFYFVCSSFMM